MTNLKQSLKIYDAGDVPTEAQEPDSVYTERYKRCAIQPWGDHKFLFFGGDHIITYLCTKMLISENNDHWGRLYLDTHPDLYEDYEGIPSIYS